MHGHKHKNMYDLTDKKDESADKRVNEQNCKQIGT